MFKTLKFQLLSSSIIAIILIACFIAFAANGYLIISIVFAVIIAAYIVCVNVWFDVYVSKPIQDLTETAKRIAAGSYGTQVKKLADNEIGDLTDEINQMSTKIGLADKATTEFVSQISHELRTPLTAITGWSETLQYDPAIQGDSLRGLIIITKEAERLTGMVTDLLIFSRIQDGRFNLRVELIDIAAEFEDSIFTYGNLMKQSGIELKYTAPDYDIPLISGDPERLKQVFLNVLDNAAKHGGTGKRIDASLTVEDGMQVIRIRDYGPGIPEGDLPYVKQKFYKGASKARGSGIGLAVCDEIIKLHDGGFEIANAPGGGCIVTIRLPEQGE